MTFLLSLLSQFWPVLIGVIGWFGARLYYKRQGAAEERAKRDAADRRVNEVADEIQNDVRAMSPEQIDAELRKRARK